MNTKKILSWCAIVLAIATWGSARAANSGIEVLEEYVSGLEGEKKEAAQFLLRYLPASDREQLAVALFRENLEEAYVARTTYPWTMALPKEVFFNDVLPHAVAAERRDPWRKRLRGLFDPLLGDAQTPREAAALVGANIARLTGVKYNRKREKACQSPGESIRQGMATCTGLSILMIDALRATGVPARLAAIPMWGTMDGNHTWVEVHDGQDWQKSDFGGSPKRWNKGWSVARCAYSHPRIPVYGIFASSYRDTGIGVPLAWEWQFNQFKGGRIMLSDLFKEQRNEAGELTSLSWSLQRRTVPGIDRTAHYIEMAGGRKVPIPKGAACVTVRAYEAGTKKRLAIPIRILADNKLLYKGSTASPQQDLNEYVRLLCKPGQVRVEHQSANGDWSAQVLRAKANKETAVKIEIENPS